MDECLFGYEESICEYETLEECTLIIFSVELIKKIIMENPQLEHAYTKLLERAMRYKIYRENTKKGGQRLCKKSFAKRYTIRLRPNL